MTNVINLPPPSKPLILVCTACRGEAFWLYQDGRVQCYGCNRFDHSETGRWSPIAASAEEQPP